LAHVSVFLDAGFCGTAQKFPSSTFDWVNSENEEKQRFSGQIRERLLQITATGVSHAPRVSGPSELL
jgi:hypothetical protein